MSEEGFQDRQKAGEDRAQARNLDDMDEALLEGPGSEARMRRIQERFRKASAAQERMPTSQLVMIGVFVFLMIILFGAGRFIIAAVAPKAPNAAVIGKP